MVSEIRKYVFLESLSEDTLQQMKLLTDKYPKEKYEKEVGLDLSKLLKISPNPLHPGVH